MYVRIINDTRDLVRMTLFYLSLLIWEIKITNQVPFFA